MVRHWLEAQRGFHLVEVVVVMAISALVLAWSVPPLLNLSRQLRVEMAAHELMGVLRTARATAVQHSANVGLKFYPSSGRRVSYVLYRDGDGDGVRTKDIEAGIDPPLSLPRELAHFGSTAFFGFPPGPAPRDPGNPRRRLRNLDDPIRFNNSNLASFSSLGGSTPGSLYLTDGHRELAVVRVFGRTGKVKVMLYDRESETWR